MAMVCSKGLQAAGGGDWGCGYGDWEDRSEVRVYEGAKHGFEVRTDPKDEGQTKSAVELQKQSLEWFGRFLTGKGVQK
ncbi:hypothetical protein VC83_09408 [Pseudogymnoascus destructans]|uniref:Dienelactone hydrolase domain-containing protein n=1 Tax=Pseudogymnoascus destructans TaxID=655981 RepID=A0A176ZZ06_9PEZI|nr:uncharacterized protein VC83_09408 [Pseudogymnoascus destructans]OAF54261.1 hypothetical protein VC83_09408 [Pseudogymnoascus destructans]